MNQLQIFLPGAAGAEAYLGTEVAQITARPTLDV